MRRLLCSGGIRGRGNVKSVGFEAVWHSLALFSLCFFFHLLSSSVSLLLRPASVLVPVRMPFLFSIPIFRYLVLMPLSVGGWGPCACSLVFWRCLLLNVLAMAFGITSFVRLLPFLFLCSIRKAGVGFDIACVTKLVRIVVVIGWWDRDCGAW